MNLNQPKHEQLEQLLTTLPHEDLIAYVRQLLHNDRQLLDKFLLRYQPMLARGEAASKQYQQLFERLVRKYSRHDYIDYEAASEFADGVRALLDTLAASNLPLQEKVESCFILAEGIAGVADNVDDSHGEVADLMYSIKHELEAAYPQLPAAMQMQLFERVLTRYFDESYYDYGLETVFAELLQAWAIDNLAGQKTYLQALDKRIASSADWRRTTLLKEKLVLLKTWNRQAEAEALAVAHMEIPAFREVFVQQAIAKHDFAQAKALLAEGIQLAMQQEHSGTVNQWHKYLLDIAYQMGDVPAIRAELERLFKTSHYNLEAYRQLKATYTAAEWVEAQQHLYQMIPAIGYDEVRAKLLQEENNLPALFALLQNSGDSVEKVRLFRQYAPLLATQFPQEVTTKYASLICTTIQGSTGRNIYEGIINDLKALQQMPGGDIMAQNLIRDFRSRYKTRKAMLEMFAKAFG